MMFRMTKGGLDDVMTRRPEDGYGYAIKDAVYHWKTLRLCRRGCWLWCVRGS
jgi:hypothetical protein